MQTQRLCQTTALPATVRAPGYRPEEYGPGIVHFGLGAFHRGHMAVYTEDVLEQLGGDWRIIGVSLRSPGVRDNLQPQDCRYTLVERGRDEERLRVIGCIKEVLVAPEDPAKVLDRLCHPAINIISFTVTEKGYLRDPATGELLADHPDIMYDLANPDTPKTMPGYITEALRRRRALGLPTVTLLCCDNLPENGRSLQKSICGFARLRDPELAAWIEQHIAFPSTMVDRIVPATTKEDIESTAQQLGCHDLAPVICETFSQWIIEDVFSSDRPAWEQFGAEIVTDVAPYEDMKLKLLNCSHSAMAYLGYLGGIDTIDQVITTPAYRGYVKELMREILPALDMGPQVDLKAYCETLISRFENPSLKHRTWQIAMDGSQKIPQRMLNTIRRLIHSGRGFPCLAMAVAGWLRYVTGIDEQGKSIEVSDPLAARLRDIADRHAGDPEGYGKAVLQLEEIFGRDLSTNSNFESAIQKALKIVFSDGASKAVASCQ